MASGDFDESSCLQCFCMSAPGAHQASTVPIGRHRVAWLSGVAVVLSVAGVLGYYHHFKYLEENLAARLGSRRCILVDRRPLPARRLPICRNDGGSLPRAWSKWRSALEGPCRGMN